MKIILTSIVDLEKSSHNRIHQFIRHLTKSHDITVLSINDWWKFKQTDVDLHNKDLKDILQNVDINYFTTLKISPFLQEPISIMKINKILKRIKYEEFDVHLNCGALISGYLISKKLKSKGINTVFDITDDNPALIRSSPQIPYILRSVGGFVGESRFKKNIKIAKKITFTAHILKELYDVPLKKAEYIPNGVETEVFKKYPASQLKDKLGLNQDFVIGFVGVLREWVNLEPVFAAVKQLSRNYRNLKLLIVGEEGGLKKNKEQARRYGISDKVIFTGTVGYTQVPRYISCMDVCLIPFKLNAVSESSLPLKLFEYMACEKPVISTKIEGIVDAVQDRVLYASTEEEYRDKIVKLYKDEELRIKLGVEGRSYVKENYEWSALASKLENVLEEVRNQ